MNIVGQVVEAEARLRIAGRSIDSFCAEISITRSTWTRWKQGKSAFADTWQRFEVALAKLPALPAESAESHAPLRAATGT